MQKEEKILREEDISVVTQLAQSLKEATLQLEEAYEREDYYSFNEIKKLMLKIQKTISEMLK